MDHVNCWCDAPLPSVADRPVELGKPREWPYPVGIPQGLLSNEALRRNTQRDAYEQTLHAQGLTSERCTCSDCCCWRVEQRRAGDDVSLCHCKECEGGYHEIDSARNAMPRKTFDGPVFDWKPLVSKTDQEFARYASEATEQIVRAYTMTPEMLGITEKPKSVSELSVKIEADVDPVINALKALRGASPDMLFVSPKDAERLFGLYDKPACNTKENPMSISSNPVADLADRARELAKDGKENLDAVKSAIEQGKIEYKARVEKALTGAADLEVLSGPCGKQFFVKHFYENKEYTTYGTAYPGYGVTDKEDEEKLHSYTVRLQDSGDPVLWGKYKTMQRLREALQNNEIPYVIKFYE